MSDSSAIEPKMRRALADEAAVGINRQRRMRGLQPEPFIGDSRPLLIPASEWRIEAIFRDIYTRCPGLRQNRLLLTRWDQFLERVSLTNLHAPGDMLVKLAMLLPDHGTEYVPQADMSPAANYWGYFAARGARGAGQIVETRGAPGSGKSMWIAWCIVKAVELGYTVIGNLRMYTDRFDPAWTGKYYEVHAQTKLVQQCIFGHRANVDKPIFAMIDEAGTHRGGMSGTATTREARWATLFLQRSRHLGLFMTRARQTENIVNAQEALVAAEVVLDSGELRTIRGRYLIGTRRGTEFTFRIPDVSAYFDTDYGSSWDYDLDIERMDKWMARHEGPDVDDLALMEQFNDAWMAGRDLYTDELEAARDAREAAEGTGEPTRSRGTRVRCLKGHSWLTRSTKRTVRCEECNERVPNPGFVQEEPEGGGGGGN